MTAHHTTWSLCPYCLYAQDAATGVTTDRQPRDGDVGICIQCYGVSVFDSSLPVGRRVPTAAEQAVIDDDAVRRTRAAAREFRSRTGR